MTALVSDVMRMMRVAQWVVRSEQLHDVSPPSPSAGDKTHRYRIGAAVTATLKRAGVF
jgi:hypothetical protein